MKPLSRLPLDAKLALLPCAALVALAPTLRAADIVKADNTTSLNLTGSWVGGSVPGTGDRIMVNALGAGRSAALGDNLSVAGIYFNSAFQFQVTNTVGKTLTVGGSGIEVTSASAANLIIASALAASAPQNWTIGSGRSLQVNGGFTDNGHTIGISGAGTLDLRGSATFGSTVTIDSTVSVNAAAAVVTLSGANTFNTLAVPSGRVVGNSIGNYTEPSAFGDGGTSTAIVLGNTTNGVLEYSGPTDESNRVINKDRRTTASGIVVTNPGTTLTLTAATNLSTTGTVAPGAAGNANWQIGGDGSLVVNGVIGNFSVGEYVGIAKTGAGTLTLGGNNTFTGTITIDAGTVAIGTASERINNAAAVDLNVGTFDLNTFSETIGSLSIDGGTSLAFDLVSPGNATALLTVAGAFTKNGGSPVSIVLSGAEPSGVYKLMTIGSGSLAESMFSVSGASGTFSLADSGTSLVFTAIPEPATVAACAGLAVLGLAFLRRRRA